MYYTIRQPPVRVVAMSHALLPLAIMGFSTIMQHWGHAALNICWSQDLVSGLEHWVFYRCHCVGQCELYYTIQVRPVIGTAMRMTHGLKSETTPHTHAHTLTLFFFFITQTTQWNTNQLLSEHYTTELIIFQAAHMPIKKALETRGYPRRPFVKSGSSYKRHKSDVDENEKSDRHKCYCRSRFERVWRIFNQRNIPVHFEAGNTETKAGSFPWRDTT